MTESQGSSFFQALFDMSFREFITTRIIKVLFVLGIVLASLGAIGILIGGLTQGGAGMIAIVVAPIAFLLWVISLRVWLELVIVAFRVADNTDILAKKAQKE